MSISSNSICPNEMHGSWHAVATFQSHDFTKKSILLQMEDGHRIVFLSSGSCRPKSNTFIYILTAAVFDGPGTETFAVVIIKGNIGCK